MKRIAKTLMTAACILAVISLHAQLPQGIKYQAVARDSDGDLIINDSFIARFTVLQGTAMSEVYKEVHHVNTNKFGLFNLVLGEGAPELGTFATIDWGADEFHLKVEIDQGDGFVTMGTSRFFSVPYSLYSEKAGEVDMSLDDLADVNAGSPSTGQVLKWDGSVWLPGTDDTGGGSFTAGTGIDITGNVISNTGDTDATDDITTSTVAGGDLNGIYPDPTVAGLQGRNVVGTAPADGQALKWSAANNRWEPQNDIGGGSGDDWGAQVALTDATLSGNGTAGNELRIAQQSASGGQVLKWDGSSWSPGNDDNTTYTNGTGIDITGTTISNTAPDQTVTLTGGGATSVSGTYPNFTITSTDNINDADADPTNELQTISKSGSTVTLSDGGGSFTDEVNDADADPNNELQTLSISGSDLTISNGNTVSLPSAGVSSLISDADNDTKVQTEESADEDIIRFDLGGTEFFRMDNGRIEVVNTGQSVFFGEGAGENDDFTSNFNTAIGYKAMNSNTNGANNVAVGANALEDNTTGASNTALGSSSLHANLTGFGNVAVGDRSMQSNQDGGSNTAVGAYSLYLNT